MKAIIATTEAPAAIGPYSQAVATNDLVFVSGQLPVDPVSSAIVTGGIKAQTRQSIRNLSAVLRQAGLDLADVLKVTVFITDMGQFSQINEVYSEYFTADCPARSCVEVGKLPLGASVEIEAIAQKNSADA